MNYWFLYDLADGSIYGAPYLGEATVFDNIPNGCGLIGPISENDVTAIGASVHPQYYLVQSGVLTQKPDYDTRQLTDVKNTKIGELSTKCDTAIVNGFSSSALTTAHTYPSDDKAQSYLGDAIKRMELDSTVTSVNFKTLDAGFLTHTLPQLQQVFKDGFDFGQAQITKYNQLKAQVEAATTVDGVNAIVW